MKKSIKNKNLLLPYLNGKLDNQSKIEVELQLLNDPVQFDIARGLFKIKLENPDVDLEDFLNRRKEEMKKKILDRLKSDPD